MMSRTNQVDDLLTRFERKTINQEKCSYKSPEELGQFLVHDYAFGNIMAGYYVRRDEDKLAEGALPNENS